MDEHDAVNVPSQPSTQPTAQRAKRGGWLSQTLEELKSDKYADKLADYEGRMAGTKFSGAKAWLKELERRLTDGEQISDSSDLDRLHHVAVDVGAKQRPQV